MAMNVNPFKIQWNKIMEKSQNTALLYSLEDYIEAFRILDALPFSAIRPEHVKPFVDAENYLLSTIEHAKRVYQSSQDKNQYALISGSESAIMAAHETLKAEGKDRKVEIYGMQVTKE